MAEAFNPYRFRWWRYDKYEIDDEWIRPAPGANLELYDPWEAYRDSWENDPDSATPFADKRLQGPPYLSLLSLLEGVTLEPHRFNLAKDTTDNLLRWCSEFGLLGVLPQRVHTVALTPRWLPKSPWGAMVGHKLERPKDGLLYPTQFIYYRDVAQLLVVDGVKVQGWNPTLMLQKKDGEKGKRLGRIYEGEMRVEPGVLIQDMSIDRINNYPAVIIVGTLFHEPFLKTWARFFPSISMKQVKQIETYLYPPPLSPPFWEIYWEPIWDFFMGALALRDAIVCLNESSAEPEKKAETYRARVLLNNLVSSSSIVLGTTPDGSHRQEWRAASLLGCFAMMALQDLTQQRKVLACERCNRLFVTEAYQARYCSDRCRHTAQKRRYRQKLKEEKDNG